NSPLLAYNFNRYCRICKRTSEERLIYVNVRPEIAVDFAASRVSLGVGAEVSFTNLTTGGYDSLYWEFEGGTPAFSMAENPVVVYETEGDFNVSLSAFRKRPKFEDAATKEDYVSVTLNPDIVPIDNRLRGDGLLIGLIFEEDMEMPSMDEVNNFTVLVDQIPVSISSLELDVNDAKQLNLMIDEAILEGQSISIDYSPGTLKSITGSNVGPLSGYFVANTIVNLLSGSNGNFENGTLGSTPDGFGSWWPQGGQNVNDKFILTDSEVQEGVYALMGIYDKPGDGYIMEQSKATSVDVDSNSVYRLSFWAKASIDNVPLDIRTIGETKWEEKKPASGNFSITTTWTKYEFDFSTDDLTEFRRRIWLQMQDANNNFDLFLDDMRMVKL
ncbi:MAG: carbohydrate binding domain-containing protein, partial [Bacteroidota bacterium]